MPPAIQQHVTFRASPKTLFDLYINSKKHTAATGAPATIGRTPGSKWNAFGGMIGGTTLLVQPGQLIVQTWRAKFWKKEDLSILTIKFTKVTGGARRHGPCRGSSIRSKRCQGRVAQILLEAMEEIPCSKVN